MIFKCITINTDVREKVDPFDEDAAGRRELEADEELDVRPPLLALPKPPLGF